ncbi:hypothetical protein QJS66_17255 [Kocuria rhizophila]|nr:hypothetical protein QJS66_17255 [Kocuria rhizophila]
MVAAAGSGKTLAAFLSSSTGCSPSPAGSLTGASGAARRRAPPGTTTPRPPLPRTAPRCSASPRSRRWAWTWSATCGPR